MRLSRAITISVYVRMTETFSRSQSKQLDFQRVTLGFWRFSESHSFRQKTKKKTEKKKKKEKEGKIFIPTIRRWNKESDFKPRSTGLKVPLALSRIWLSNFTSACTFVKRATFSLKTKSRTTEFERFRGYSSHEHSVSRVNNS